MVETYMCAELDDLGFRTEETDGLGLGHWIPKPGALERHQANH